MSLPNPTATLRRHVPLISAQFAITAPILRGTGFGVLPLAGFADTARDFVGTSRNDRAVVVRIRIRCARDRGEERIRRITIPARSRTHSRGVRAPRSHGSNARVPVLILAGCALDMPKIRIIARERFLNRILTDDRVGVAEDIRDVVRRPLADGVSFKNSAAILRRMRLFADTDLTVPGAEFHAAFCGAVGAGHDAAVAVCFVEGHFVAGPVDDAVGGGGFGEAVGLVVGEEWGREEGEEEEGGRGG